MNDEHLDWRAWLDADHRRPLPAIDRATHVADVVAATAAATAGDGACALLVTGAANLRWLTGFTGSNGCALVLPDHVVLLTDPRYEGRAAVECPGVEVVVTRELVEHAVELAGRAGVERLAFESEHVSHRTGTRIEQLVADADGLVGCDVTTGVVEGERVVKAPAELARLARACAITEAVLDEVLAGGLAGTTEREVARRVEDGLRGREAAVGFPTIVAAGPNGAVPHHEPTTRIIDDGDLVTIDCGARIDGYHADTTRTVAVGRMPSTDTADLAAVFALVAEAQQAGVDAVRAGAGGADVDGAARRVVAEAGHAEAFVHGTGHGVGLQIHEAPVVAGRSSDTLAPDTPLTVEPGVYLPGCGGVRIEDTVVTAAEGPALRLTDSPRELLVV